MSRTNLGLVLGLHVRGSQDLGVDALREAGVDVLPRRPDGEAEAERASDAEHGIPDDPPKECVEEEEHEVHDIHDRECERGLVPAEGVAEVLVVTASNHHPNHDPDRVLEGESEEEVRLGELAAEDEEPESTRRETRRGLQSRVARCERLTRKILP